MGILLVLATVVLTLAFYVGYRALQRVHIPQNQNQPKLSFSVNAFGEIISQYINRMPEQQKMNSPVLRGAGKMHYVDVVADGSQLIYKNNISVLKNLGDKFS